MAVQVLITAWVKAGSPRRGELEGQLGDAFVDAAYKLGNDSAKSVENWAASEPSRIPAALWMYA